MKKLKTCKNCGAKFTPRFTTLERFCWAYDCKVKEALDNLQKQKKAEAKKDRQRLLQKKRDLKTLPKLQADLQKLVNEYVRYRDAGLPCISCNAKLDKDNVNAGHYLPAGYYPAIRYDLKNINNQCIECNHHRGGNRTEYRDGLIKKIGLAEVESLEARRHESRKYSRIEILELIDLYKAKVKEIKKN